MRRRSNTLFAENMEEYTKLALTDPSFFPQGNIKRSNSKKKINASSLLPLLFTEDKTASRQVSQMEIESCESPTLPTDKLNSSMWSDFDFNSRESTTDASDKMEEIRDSFEEKPQEWKMYGTDSTEDTELNSSPEFITKSVTRKCMVVGARGSGRHSLINSIFESQKKEGQSPLRQTMDLIIHSRKEGNQETKYQFWMRALNDNRFDGLIKVYYRNASIFFFVYSINDRQSFEILDEAIQSILKEVPREKFIGILLGNKSDLKKQRKVHYTQGALLKEKYGLSMFLETNQEDQASKTQLFSFLNKVNLA